MLLYEYVDNVIIYITLFHFIFYFLLEVAIFILLIKTGSGLKLVPHKLKNNWLQFEGYDSQGKHLFTFTLNEYQTTATQIVNIRTRSDSSEFSGDDEVSGLDLTNHNDSHLDTSMQEKFTDYEAAEKLLTL